VCVCVYVCVKILVDIKNKEGNSVSGLLLLLLPIEGEPFVNRGMSSTCLFICKLNVRK